MAKMDVRVVDNPEELRYELRLGATRAGFIQYRSEPGTILLVHTEVEPAFEGRGLGARLVTGALDDLRAGGRTVVALCPFVRAYLRHHHEYADLVAPRPGWPRVTMAPAAHRAQLGTPVVWPTSIRWPSGSRM